MVKDRCVISDDEVLSEDIDEYNAEEEEIGEVNVESSDDTLASRPRKPPPWHKDYGLEVEVGGGGLR